MTPPKLELRYNGDYPGYAYIKVNGRTATRAEEDALVSIFGARGVRHLFDILGAKRTGCSEEHMPHACFLTPTPIDPD